VAYAAGALLSWRLWPTRAKPAVLLAALALPVGLSVTSSAYFLLLVVSAGRASWYPALEAAALVVAAGCAWRGRERARLLLPSRPRPSPAAAGLVLFAGGALITAMVILREAEVAPWGYWDAWSRINLKARFLYAGGPDWSWMFRSDVAAQPDYPLLLECSVARLWRWSGGIDPLPPQALSVLGWAGCLAALVALAARLRSSGVAAVAGLACLCQRSDRAWAALQYADFALATWFLWSAGLLVLALRRGRHEERWWPLIGFCFASAAWCKNEGLVFALLVLGTIALRRFRAPRRWRAALALGRGLLPGGVAVLVLKLGFAGRSFVFGARTRSVWAELTDPSRYRTVGGYLARHLSAEMAGWALLALALTLVLAPRGRRAPRSWLPLALCSGLALAYSLVLVTTNFDLDWLAGTTIDRFVLQLWPLAILGVVAGLRSTGRSTE
jgi:hypothetical protein